MFDTRDIMVIYASADIADKNIIRRLCNDYIKLCVQLKNMRNNVNQLEDWKRYIRTQLSLRNEILPDP